MCAITSFTVALRLDFKRYSKFVNAAIILFIITTTLTIQSTMASAPNEEIISPTLLAHLETGETATVILKMIQGTQEVLDGIQARIDVTGEDRGTAVSKSLEEHAEKCQRHIKEFLDSQTPPVKYQSMWINNSFVIYEATESLVRALAQLGDIKEIREEKTVTTMKSVVSKPKPGIQLM